MKKVYYSNELTHWGIKGQKWGVRRYQNEDGTLTEAGKRRYAKELHKRFEQTEDEYVTASNKHRFFKKLAEDDPDSSDKVAGVLSNLTGDYEDLNGMTVKEAADHFEKKAKEAESKMWKLFGEAAENGISVVAKRKSPKQLRAEARGKAFVTDAAIVMASVGISAATGTFIPLIPIATSNAFMPNYDRETGRYTFEVKPTKKGERDRLRLE